MADLYLGYGLSASLRRLAAPAPPEPCPLPLLACRVRPASRPARVSTAGYELGEWERSWDDEGYAAAIEAGARRDRARRGLPGKPRPAPRRPVRGRPLGARARRSRHLRPLQPRPFGGSGWAVVSASPELLLARRGARLVTAPIKGTRPAGVEVDGEKDGAEHVMIVDLDRNDLARVCGPARSPGPS